MSESRKTPGSQCLCKGSFEKCFPMPLQEKKICGFRARRLEEKRKKNADDCLLACTLLDNKRSKAKGSGSLLLLPTQEILQGKSKRDEISDRDGLLAECTKAKRK